MGVRLPESVKAKPKDREFLVWPDNWSTLHVFLQCATQWRHSGMGGVTGLDYAGVDVVLRRTHHELPDTVFEDIQAMERAALTAFHEKTKQQGKTA